LRRSEIVSGNAIRVHQLCTAMQHSGHDVFHVWLQGPGQNGTSPSGSFRNRDELHGIIKTRTPDVILLAYWELATLLPFDLPQPVVLDFVAPRPLEELFENPQTVRTSLRRLRTCLERIDLVLVGNGRQRDLLINTLIEAGFDLRPGVPVMVVPLGGEKAGEPHSNPESSGWLLVSGGVSWPWRNTETYMRALAKAAQGHARPIRIVQFDGAYRWHEPRGATGPDLVEQQVPGIEHLMLQPYEKFSEFLTSKAHIGVELADWNIERAYSQSFRSLEFLCHGLPVICNRYLPLASMLEEYNAGWLVDGPDQLDALLVSITSAADDWREKSAGAQRLVTEILQPDRSVRPLLEWLKSPRHATRLPACAKQADQPVLGVPPWKERLLRQYQLVKKAGLRRLFGQRKAGQGVVIVTRSDIFPADHGAAVRTVETARALAQSGLAVGIVTDKHGFWYEFANGEFRPRRFPFWVHLFSFPAPIVKLLHYSKNLPLSNSFLYLAMTDGGFYWRTLAAARQIHAGILQAEFPAYARACIRARELLDCRVVMVEHNVEFERLRSQLAELTDAQYRNLKEIELSLCQQSDAVVCVSDNDRQKLAAEGVESARLHTILHGVNLHAYRVPPVPGLRKMFAVGDDEPLLVFHGTFSYPPNRQALRIFAEILLPGLEQRGLRCHVLAVGREPPPTKPHERIHFIGSVDAMAPWLKAADLAVIPLTEGGGTRMKIIDCFAAALPVVSTPKGIEGIPIQPGRHALVCDDWDEMMDTIIQLWRDPQHRHALARAGTEMASELDWSAIAARYRSLYAALL